MSPTICLALLLALPAETSIRLPSSTPSDVGLDAKRLAPIDDAIADAIRAKQCPGAVVLIARNGKVAYRKAYGDRALEPKKEAMTADTIFDLASLTKPIATAASIHLLAEKGKLKTSDAVAKHLPAFATADKEKITVEQLLLHISGFAAGSPVGDYSGGKKKMLEKVAGLKLAYEPGKKFIYSDIGYIVLGELVEKLSGASLDAYAHKHLFAPLGLSTLSFRPEKSLLSRCAPTQKDGDDWMRGTVHDPRARVLGGVAGHAGLFGTADDLAVFAQMLLDGGMYEKKRVLSAETVKEYTKSREVPGGKRTLGWDAKTAFSSNRGEHLEGYGHTGFTGTSIWIDPEKKLTVILLTNRVHPDGKGNVVKLRARIATLAALSIEKGK